MRCRWQCETAPHMTPCRSTCRAPLGRRLVVRCLCACFPRLIGTDSLRRQLGLNPSLIDAGAFPKLTGDLDGIDASLRPPGLFVTDAMYRAVMEAAEWDGEFIACFAAEGARLHNLMCFLPV